MNAAGRVVRQALAVAALGILVAAAVQTSVIKRFLRGEFRESFFQPAEYSGIRLITLAEAEDLWRTGEAGLIDARRAALFAEGHAPGARSVPAAEAEKRLRADVLALPPDGPLVVYCEGGDCQSSLLLAKRLHDAGFRDIRVMTGGWAAWVEAGLPQDKNDGQK